MKTYEENAEDLARFKQLLDDRVFAYFYTHTDRVPKPWYRKAWETFGNGHSEHVVRLALQYLESGFRRDKVVESFRMAREHAFRTIDREGKPKRDEGRGVGMAGAMRSLLNDPNQDRHTRAVFALTRWNLNRKRRQPPYVRAEMDREFEDLLTQHNSPQFIDQWDPQEGAA